MLVEFYSHCKERKRNYKYKNVAFVDINSMPIEFKAIDEENGEVFYISQRHLWAKREGMAQKPLNNFC